MLTPTEERRLAGLIAAGREARGRLEGEPSLSPEVRKALEGVAADGERAVETFVESNLRLVVSIARRYRHSGLPLPDLVQEGSIGLLRAVERFDPGRGVRFSTFATWLIRQAIVRAIANTGRLVRLPVRAGEVTSRVRNMALELEAALGRTASTAQVATALGMPVERVERALRQAEVPLSLSSRVAEDGELELGSTVGDAAPSAADTVAASLVRQEIHHLVDQLTERQRLVLTLRYGLDGGDPKSFAEAARRLELSLDATRSAHRQALVKLRALLGRADEARLMLAG